MNKLDTQEKLEILSQDSQYDLACACGTGSEDRRKRTSDGKWLYPVSLPGGGHSVMLKTLFSNSCVNDCTYCPLRADGNIRRCSLGVDETAKAFMEYVERKKVFGLFLSSGVIGTADGTMDKLNGVARVLRYKYAFKGYIHLKVLPGASDAAIEDALSVANAVSLNIETPGKRHFDRLTKTKDYDEDIIRPLKVMSKLTGKGERYSSRKCTTQFIVGASDEQDCEIVKYMFGLYKRLRFERIYFSAYQADALASSVADRVDLKLDTGETLMREHRLYQADFLIRSYGFSEDDFFFGDSGLFDLDRDPKEVWAHMHPECYPVNINLAEKDVLLRVPGLGPTMVNRILKARKESRIDKWNIVKLNVTGQRYTKILPYITFG